MRAKLFLVVILLAAICGLYFWRHDGSAKTADSTVKTVSGSASQTAQQAAVKAKAATAAKAKAAQEALNGHCAGSSSGKTIIVSISRQHMWACSDLTAAYSSPVITGKAGNGDETPTGTYRIASKLTDQTLTGCEPGDCWNDHVDYWMPYQYLSGGTIGFHDATWRKNSEFGNTPPSSNQGSHGCVEMPLAAMKWLYNWAPVGTAVNIES